MKSSCLAVIALGACAAAAHAQTNEAYRGVTIPLDSKQRIALIDATDLSEPGTTSTATRVFGYPGKRMGLENAGVRGFSTEPGRRQREHRAWGISVGLQAGPITFRAAHQNKNVAKVAPSMPMGARTDAKNSIIAANVDLGIFKAYTAYSANRGWGSSPLWNPDNPYGAAMATTPSTDSRDVLVGVAMPMGATTWLATFVRKNDRDLANRDAEQFAFGATYTISRRTDFYAAYSHTELRNGAGHLAGIPTAPVSGSSALNVGMRHSF